MKVARLALLALVSLAMVACSSGGGASAPSAAASASTRIEVALTDSMAIELDAMTVPAGVPVTFVVSNTGAADHEFYLGDESAQLAHEDEMMANGGMSHDDPNGIAVAPGETKELIYTFSTAGPTLAGCHIAGHYAAGMMAQLTVTD